MKLLPLAVAAVGLLTVSSLHAQDAALTRRLNREKARNAQVKLAPRTDGVIPRAIRSGQPLQMVNPAAPAEYGNGSDMVVRDPNDPYARPRGFKLLAFEF